MPQPVIALAESRFHSDKAEDIGTGDDSGHGIGKTIPQFLIGNDDTGGMQTGEIKSFTGRHTNDAVLGKFIGDGGERCVLVTFVKDFAVDFIGNDDAAVADDNLTRTGGFCFSPKAADGVLRIAENNRLGAAVGHTGTGSRLKFTFQIPQVYGIAFAVKLQGIIDDFAAVLGDDREKGEIDRFLENNFIAGTGKGTDGSAQGRNDAGCKYNPFRPDLPVEFTLHAADNGLD